jgi:hypothetical protein
MWHVLDTPAPQEGHHGDSTYGPLLPHAGPPARTAQLGLRAVPQRFIAGTDPPSHENARASWKDDVALACI